MSIRYHVHLGIFVNLHHSTTIRDDALEALVSDDGGVIDIENWSPPFYALSNRSAVPIGNLGTNEWGMAISD